MLTEDAFRQRLVTVHLNQRAHMWGIIEGISAQDMTRRVSDEANNPSIVSILRHTANAETYWMHKAGFGIAPPLKVDDVDAVLGQLKRITEALKDTLRTCPAQQLRIQAPAEKTAPSIAWAVLRTSQHGIYHTGQIAKIRHMIGVPAVPHDDTLWGAAVDSIILLLRDTIQS